MLAELTPTAFERVRSLYANVPDVVAHYAVIEGNAPGQIFVDDPQAPTSALIWTPFHFGYLGGRADNAAFNAALRDLLVDTIFPAAHDSSDPSAILYPASAAWLAPIDDLLAVSNPIPLVRQTFVFDPTRVLPVPDQLPDGVRLRRVDESLLSTADHIVHMLSDLWCSLDAFLAHGIGFCVTQNTEIASECLSVFAAGRQREIGISTLDAYRRKGYATLTAAAFLADCIENDLDPVWECWRENAPSIALAEKVGFKRASQRDVRYFRL